MNSLTPRWLILLAGAALIAPTTKADDDYLIMADRSRSSDWTRNFRVGMQLGLNIHANFSSSGVFPVSGSNPGAPGVSGVNHVYDDGYVRVDETGNAGGYTSYWGYNNAGQYDSGAKTLTYHSAKSYSANSGTSQANDVPYIGLDAAYGGFIRNWGPASVGWDLGFGFLPIAIKDNRSFSATLVTSVQTVPTGGVVLPTAPYNGGSSGVGVNIPDVTTAQPDQIVAGTVSGTRTLDVTLYHLRLGPTLQLPVARQLKIQVSAGPALGIVSGDYRFNESPVSSGGTARNIGKFGKTDLVYGGYVNALALFRVEEHGDIFVGAQFMSLSGSKFSKAGREAKLSLSSGIYLTAGLSWPF